MPNKEQIGQQFELLATHRRNLSLYLRQQASLGELFTLPGVVNGIHDTRNNILRIKSILREWGESVEDHPDDEWPDTPIPNTTDHQPNTYSARERGRSTTRRESSERLPISNNQTVHNVSGGQLTKDRKAVVTLIGLVVLTALLAASVEWWLPKLLRVLGFVQARSDTIQGLVGTIQLIIWLCGILLFLFNLRKSIKFDNKESPNGNISPMEFNTTGNIIGAVGKDNTVTQIINGIPSEEKSRE